MAHDYNPITTPATSYTEVSPIRPVGDAEEQFTRNNINTIWTHGKSLHYLVNYIGLTGGMAMLM